jgi:hypothetical protein
LVAEDGTPHAASATRSVSIPDQAGADRNFLQEHGLPSDGPALLDYLRKRTRPETDSKETTALIAQLGDDDFEVREKAYDRLFVLGASVLGGIKKAAKNQDAEVSRRADQLRQRIEAKAEAALQAAVARLIAALKPAGAADVLLRFVPFAADQQATDEVCKALAAVAVVSGKLEPCVAQALVDSVPLKRAAAAEACARSRVLDLLPRVRKLLADPEPGVRLRVALALVPYKEKQVLSVLVDVLGRLGPEEVWPAEEVLARLAGEDSPAVALGTTDQTRRACQTAWQAWLDTHQSLDLAKLEAPRPLIGYTLVVQQNNNRVIGNRRPITGEVLELDAGKPPKTRWHFEIPAYAVDAQIVQAEEGERVLIAEYQTGTISERDFKGEVKWQKLVTGNPIGVQRLASGNTFVAMPNRLVELDRSGREVFVLKQADHDIARARKFRNGDVAVLTKAGVFRRLEGRTRKELKSFNVGQVPIAFGSIDVLAGGGVLVPDFQHNRVIEFDADGKQVKVLNVEQPNAVSRVPNGHTLVTSQHTRRVIEFDSDGREVWSHAVEGIPFNAKRR